MLHHKSPDRDDAKLTKFLSKTEKNFTQKFLLDHDQMITMKLISPLLPLAGKHETSFN